MLKCQESLKLSALHGYKMKLEDFSEGGSETLKLLKFTLLPTNVSET